MNDINEFDKIIKEKMGGFKEMPPSHLWANISAGIVPKAAIIPFYQQAYFKIALLIASIVVILGISWYLPQNPKYNTISSNIENIQNTKNEITNSNSPSKNINIENNNSENNEVLTSNNEELKKTIETKTIVENTSTETKEEVKPSVVKLANINKNNSSRKQNKTKVIPSVFLANNSSQNNISKASLIQEQTTEKSIDVVENNNEELQNNSTENKVENSKKTIAAVAIPSQEEVVKEVITPENKEKIIAKTISKEELISEEETQEPIQAVVKENKAIVNETKEEESTENTIETTTTDDITQTPNDIILNSEFRPEGVVFDKYSIGVHYGYEQINTSDLNVASNNFDLSFSSQNGNFTTQTGIGFQVSKDKNSYKQYYARNEYLATQVRFDSIIFVDNGNGDFTPVAVNPYYTDVYDTINYNHNDVTSETYYSIKIPLFLGYKKSLKHVDIFAQGGIIYSHIFRNKTGEMNQLDSESRMLESEYLINERQDNQIQYVAAAGVSYGITKRLYLNAELMAKYYHYSLYKNTQSNTNTWSYEARFGVTYLLN